MNKLFLLLLAFLQFPIFAEDVQVTFLKGKVEATENKTPVTLEIGKSFSEKIRITTREKGEVRLSTRKGEVIIKENNSLEIAQLLSFDKYVQSSVTEVAGSRGLYENVQVQLQKASKEAFDGYVANCGGKLEDHNGWKVVIELAFSKLIKSSGKEQFTMEYAILKNDAFNAAALPGGQFIIHTNALDVLDTKVDEYLKNNKIAEKNKNLYREYYIASILGHELSHYYNQHSLKTQMKIVGEASQDDLKAAAKQLDNIKYSQDLELDADLSGFFLLKKAGYEPIWMTNMLEVLKEIYKEGLKNNKNLLPYFQSHPSPNERLSKIPSDKQEWYRFLSRMEQIFADIQLGANLKNCILELENALKLYPGNSELMKAKAVAQHKVWITTVPLEDQVLRVILDMQAFIDEMIIGDDANKAKGDKKIPGDIESYLAAKDSYIEVFKKLPSTDPGFISNYASLLIYSPDPVEIKKAVQLAEEAYGSGKSIQAFNNLGVVYWIAEDKPKAIEVFDKLASEVDSQIKTVMTYATFSETIRAAWNGMKTEIAIRSSFDSNYVSEQFTPVLNYSLLQVLNGNKKMAKQSAENYLEHYESDSEWAKYLANVTQVKIHSTADSYKMDGLTIGDSEKVVFQKWYTPDAKDIQESKSGEDTKKIIDFSKKSAKVALLNGKTKTIYTTKGKAAKINDIVTIGDSVSDLEKALGKPAIKAKSHIVYNGKQKLKFVIKKDKVKEIYLY